MKYFSDLDQNVKEMVDVDSAKFLNNLTNTSTSDSQNFTFIPHKRYPLSITTQIGASESMYHMELTYDRGINIAE